MQAKRFDEYHKHGCHFFGKLVVVDYLEDMHNDPKWGTFNSGITYDYLAKANEVIKERYGSNTETLLSIPSLVVRIKQ